MIAVHLPPQDVRPPSVERFCIARVPERIRVGDRWIIRIVDERGVWRDGRCVPDGQGRGPGRGR